MHKKTMNQFEELCKLASNENWCWNLSCTTCGHMHFRYAFSELAIGKSPDKNNWIIHRQNTKYSNSIGPLPRSYTKEQKETILDICTNANLSSIASDCKFPDWLGYLGLVLEHMYSDTSAYMSLSSSWASQLADMVPASSLIHDRLDNITNNGILNIRDLKEIESYMMNRYT